MTESFLASEDQTLSQAFPDVVAGVAPLGARVLVQIRRVFNRTKSGIILADETKETVKWNSQVGRVIALGPLAFRNRETMNPWAEGIWVKPGDFVRVPRWNGDRIEVAVDDDMGPVTFVCFNDHELIARIDGDPLKIKTYLL